MIERSMGHYQIVERLAVGGMAEIFLARSTAIKGFQKYVVLKRILPQYIENPDFLDMFLDEARLAARLTHQNIAQVYDFGEMDGSYYLVMEYLHGEDVKSLLKRAAKAGKPIPLKHVLNIVANVAAGLHYAHEAQDDEGAQLHIVHRDVAPSNIIVTYDGAVKLLDFGIARAQSHTYRTDTGVLKGKISYMSPEQIRAKELDGRSDVFALGIVLYELTTMSRLFPVGGRDKLEVMRRIAKGKIERPSRRVYHYSPRLEAIVMRALSLDRKYRYQTADELLHDIEKLAVQKNFSMSPIDLGRYVRKLAGHPPEPWRRRKGDGSSPPTLVRDRDDDSAWERLALPMVRKRKMAEVVALASAAEDSASEDVLEPNSTDSKPDEITRTETVRLAKLRRARLWRAAAVLVALAGIAAVVAVLFFKEHVPWLQRGEAQVQSAATRALPVKERAAPVESKKAVASAPEVETKSDTEAKAEVAAAPDTSTPAAGKQAASEPETKAAPEAAAKTAREAKKPRESRAKKRARERRLRAKKRKARRAKANARRQKATDKRSRKSSDENWDPDDLFPPSKSP